MTNPTTPPSPQQAKLLRCPFCGELDDLGVETHDHSRDWETNYVHCPCGAEGPAKGNRDWAIAGWNRRAPQAVSEPPAGVAVAAPGDFSDDDLWRLWWARPAVKDGEPDDMEAEFVAAVRRIIAAERTRSERATARLATRTHQAAEPPAVPFEAGEVVQTYANFSGSLHQAAEPSGNDDGRSLRQPLKIIGGIVDRKAAAVLRQARDALVYHREQTRPIAQTDEAIAAIDAALASQAAPELESSTPLAGWIFNHAQQSEDDEGAWEVGHMSDEGTFSRIATVDTGLYFQPQEAEPLARAILARLCAPSAPIWSVFNSGGATVAEGVTFSVAYDYMTPERVTRGWTMVVVIKTLADLEAARVSHG